jgi:hypothetical protein
MTQRALNDGHGPAPGRRWLEGALSGSIFADGALCRLRSLFAYLLQQANKQQKQWLPATEQWQQQ